MDLKYFERHSKVLVCRLKKKTKTSLHAQLAHLLSSICTSSLIVFIIEVRNHRTGEISCAAG